METQAVNELLRLLPDHISFFKGSEYVLPLKTTFLGNEKLSIEALRKELSSRAHGDAKDLLEPVLLASELYEASTNDHEQFFITDSSVRSFVFNSKWKAGWVLVLGCDTHDKLIEKLKEKDFRVFTDCPDIPDTFFIGARSTSPIYFLQMMVRYGLVWGRISPGDDHAMGHFLEKDLPGFIIINKDLEPLKYLIALGIMKLGAPALVPSSFPFPYGNRIVTDHHVDLIESGIHFPNLRLRYYKDEVISLPDYCNPAFVNETIETGHVLGGGPASFFCVKSAQNIEPGVSMVGHPSSQIGILVEIENSALSDDLTQVVEQTALRAINYIPGIKAYQKEDAFYLQTVADAGLDSKRIGEAIHYGIRLQYPRLEKIKIQIIFDESLLADEVEQIRHFQAARGQLIANMTEENTEEFCACIECRPFSLEHTCILPPDRTPMCASRTYFSIKAESCLGSSIVPFKRQSEKELPLKLVFNKGRALDLARGEYEGCNKAYEYLTGGRLKKVYLHSLRGFPHTSCGCFQNLAFWIEEDEGIGIMSRNSKATAPNGQTWDTLANYAGGKQSNGIMGVSLSYIRSPHFLTGDGGIGNVVWVDSVLYNKISSCLLPGHRVATEKDVSSIEELERFRL
jgi:CO dehydrogenase/acetyl-CoA synthase beta subunit